MSLFNFVPCNNSVDKRFASIYDLFDSVDRRLYQQLVQTAGSSLSYCADVIERDDEYELRINLPGVNKKDIDLSVSKDELRIKVDKSYDKTNDYENYHLNERSHVKIDRTFKMNNIDETNVVANLTDGVLSVVVKKLLNNLESRKIMIN